MAREEKQIEIEGADGVRYVFFVRQMAPMKALHTLTDLVKMIGPALAPVASNVGEFSKLLDKDVSELRTDFLGEAVVALTGGLNHDTIDSVIHALRDHTEVKCGDSNRIPLSKVFDLTFTNAGLGALIKWIPFALQAQYDDFLAVIVSASKSVPRHDKTTKAQA